MAIRDIQSVAILGMGDMGSAVANSLRNNGLTVLTCLDGRSRNSCMLAQQAGVRCVADLPELVSRAEVFLSIMPPAAAKTFATIVCPLIRERSPQTLFVDCNAISPASVGQISRIADENRVRFQDVGIVGASPRAGRPPVRFYTSGPFESEMRRLATKHIQIENIGSETGRASAVKMVYASITKVTNSIHAAAAIVAERLGVSEEIHAEWRRSLPEMYAAMQKRLPLISADADRWAGEMREIADTYQSVGMTPGYHEAAEWLFDYIAASELGQESRREAAEKNRTLMEVIGIWSAMGGS